MPRYDAIVLGLGAAGSATLYQLARRGRRVLGLDRFSPPHAQGSTHGDTRITRLAIGEGARYTPLAMRSHEIWRELEAATGRTLLTTCGGLVVSSVARTAQCHGDAFFANTVAAAREHGIAHELLDARALRRRFPQFSVGDDETGYYEPSAGFVRPEACVDAQLALAAHHGADVHRGEPAVGFDASDRGVTVVTDHGNYTADALVVCAGPWLPQLVGESVGRHLAVYRQVLCWFALDGPLAPFLPGTCPVFIWELTGRPHNLYGFPALDGAHGGVKVASERYDATTTPDAVLRDVSAAEIRALYDDYVAPFVSGLGPDCVKATTCLYTVTPDADFVIDTLPGAERVLVASPCSGHGFKHSAAIGEALAQRLCDGASRLDLTPFALARFAS